MVNKFLPIIDDLERYVEANDKTAESVTVINMILKKFHDTLLSYGIKKYNSLGEKASHDLHNIIALEEADSTIEPNTIVKVYQDGYKFNNKVLRFASVGVAK